MIISSKLVKMEASSEFGTYLRQLILTESIDQPLLFPGAHNDWEPCKWSLDDWGSLFKNEKLRVRVGQKCWDHLEPQWESECAKCELTWSELMGWLDGTFSFLPQNGSPKDAWLYYDYKYLPDVFPLNASENNDSLKVISFNENLKKKFSWNKLGFPERDGDNTTLWVGTPGSYTPCHYDTYSCNLVCQVLGSKTWLLFPPEDISHLQPTRIPYEESSVYSRINFASQKRLDNNLQDLRQCKPYKVTLNPGDCLFLPPKWWHFVKSEEFSISVNTWIELPGDHLTRVEEAVLRSVVSSVVNLISPDSTDRILNPNEVDVSDLCEVDINDMLHGASSAYLEALRKETLEITSNSGTSCNESKSSEEPKIKRFKAVVNLPQLLRQYPARLITILPFHFPEQDVSSNAAVSSSSSSSESPEIDNSNGHVQSPTYLEHLINSIGHPSVLKQIASQFIFGVTQKPPK